MAEKEPTVQDEQLDRMINNVVEYMTHSMTPNNPQQELVHEVLIINDDEESFEDDIDETTPPKVEEVNSTLFNFLPIMPLFRAQILNDSSWIGCESSMHTS